MGKIEFSAEEKKALLARIQDFAAAELGEKIGVIASETMLDFFAGELGNFFYNRGLHDAQAAIAKRFDEVVETVYALEKPTDFRS